MSVFTSLIDDTTSTTVSTAIRLGQELSRYCAGRNANGATVCVRVKKTKVPNVYIGAEALTDKACIVIDTDDDGIPVEFTVYNGGPHQVSQVIDQPVGVIETEACGDREGRSFDDAAEAVAYWQTHR